MPYDQTLANRVREALVNLPDVEEKEMFSGLVFMVDKKMCICVVPEGLMCRIDPAIREEVLEINGCMPMVMKGREMKGFVVVGEAGLQSDKQLSYWVGLCVEYNKIAKAYPKKKKK